LLRAAIGPTIGLTRTHGAEFYLLGTLICLPCLILAGIANRAWLKFLLLTVAAFTWAYLGLFMTS